MFSSHCTPIKYWEIITSWRDPINGSELKLNRYIVDFNKDEYDYSQEDIYMEFLKGYTRLAESINDDLVLK